MKASDKNRDPERARKRAMADAKCAWRKMDEEQRYEFVEWAKIPAIDASLERNGDWTNYLSEEELGEREYAARKGVQS